MQLPTPQARTRLCARPRPNLPHATIFRAVAVRSLQHVPNAVSGCVSIHSLATANGISTRNPVTCVSARFSACITQRDQCGGRGTQRARLLATEKYVAVWSCYTAKRIAQHGLHFSILGSRAPHIEKAYRKRRRARLDRHSYRTDIATASDPKPSHGIRVRDARMVLLTVRHMPVRAREPEQPNRPSSSQ